MNDLSPKGVEALREHVYGSALNSLGDIINQGFDLDRHAKAVADAVVCDPSSVPMVPDAHHLAALEAKDALIETWQAEWDAARAEADLLRESDANWRSMAVEQTVKLRRLSFEADRLREALKAVRDTVGRSARGIASEALAGSDEDIAIPSGEYERIARDFMKNSGLSPDEIETIVTGKKP